MKSKFGRTSRTWCLWSPAVGICLGTECRDRHEAAVLLSDRRANGDAFEAEEVRLVSVEDYEDAYRMKIVA